MAKRESKRRNREFRRGLFGYRRADVDARLAQIDATISELQGAVDDATSVDHRDLVQRATRRSVEQTIEDAHLEAAEILTAAERDARHLLADAYDLVQAKGEVIDLRSDEEAETAEAESELAAAESDLFAPEAGTGD